MRPEEYNIPKEKFTLVNEDKKLHDKELVTKPVGYFKDAMYRFRKNKGSITGAVIIGLLVLYAIIAPIISPYTVSYNDVRYSKILPKLFDSEKIDFLDGAQDKKSNIVSFINYYSMGLETGHNAIKRQDYKYNEETDMYSYRLDSYHAVGTVFMSSVTKADYDAIQDYQDRTGLQVIYPITDPDKRPTMEKNLKDANYWYETENDGRNDVPVNYTINDDGSVTLTNIYKAYETPLFSSTTNASNGAKIKLVSKDDGYAFSVYALRNIKEGTKTRTDFVFTGYVKLGIDEAEDNYADVVTELENASSFKYSDTYGAFYTYIGGHEDPSENKNYYMAISKTVGSTAEIIDETELASGEYVPFTLYKDGVEQKTFNLEDEYQLTANRVTETISKYYAGSFLRDLSGYTFSVESAMTSASKITLTPSGTGYLIKAGTAYVNAGVDGNNNVIQGTTSAASAMPWEFDVAKNAFKVNLTGHTDPSLDGDYYLGISLSGKKTIALLNETQLAQENNFVLKLVNSTLVPITVIDPTATYYFNSTNKQINNTYYVIDGNSHGDNYHSRMRIEGEDTYKYSYAIRKDGNMFEIRVNYYEYYHYYHKEILRDRISVPYFLFGTTAAGQDIFTCLASGARFSFLLAISVALVNFLVGTIYGAIEGYYGGKVDMIMERIVEILSAVPFMIVITLLKYHMGGTSQVIILFIAFFLTGWIGMSGLVRMQFYRFKNQEYVLASRTLGAKDLRIMFKHIFPNSLGTIITSTVLVIPGMIFSETTLSYLGIINLNSGNMTSVGTLLAAGQPYLVTYPHMILFPAMYISLLMLCFNLFGNGLRDAFNPSLRGTEE